MIEILILWCQGKNGKEFPVARVDADGIYREELYEVFVSVKENTVLLSAAFNLLDDEEHGKALSAEREINTILNRDDMRAIWKIYKPNPHGGRDIVMYRNILSQTEEAALTRREKVLPYLERGNQLLLHKLRRNYSVIEKYNGILVEEFGNLPLARGVVPGSTLMVKPL
jgi:hypothetical protein